MSLATIPALGENGSVHVVVESPRGSSLKLKYEPRWDAIGVSRPLPVGLVFPFDWGFVPSTTGPDGDPIDAFLMWDVVGHPGIVVTCRLLGVLRIEQNATNFDRSRRIRNDRVLALPTVAHRQGDWRTYADMPPRLREECVAFTIAAAALEGKDVVVHGWGDPDEALDLVKSGM